MEMPVFTNHSTSFTLKLKGITEAQLTADGKSHGGNKQNLVYTHTRMYTHTYKHTHTHRSLILANS